MLIKLTTDKHEASRGLSATAELLVMYGCETWAITKYLLSRLDAFDTWALRKILRIPYTRHMSNAVVTTFSPGDVCGSLAILLSVHLVRTTTERPAGKPSHTWFRAIEADLGPLNFGLATA